VPYRGVAPAVLAVNRGEVDLYCSDIPGALTLLQGDKVTALGITSAKRSPTCRTFRRSPRLACRTTQTGYVGIMATGGTPRPSSPSSTPRSTR
jgi:tripartite-type tricarboxylate transporter receptor subunit TctC